MKNLFPFLLLILMVVISSCGGRSALVSKIDKAEAGLKADSLKIPDNEKVKEVQALYLSFSKEYPSDTLAPEYLLKAADLATFLHDYKTTIGLYDRILTDYKQFSKAPQALFLKAFTYDQYIQDPMKAAELYRQFISLYPNHDLADDASQALLFCGKTDEEIMQMLQERAVEESDSTKR